MALEQDTISIDLAQGVNNKVDDKIAGPDQTSTLIDARFDKDKRLIKRRGLTAQSQAFQGNFAGEKNFINPVVLNSTSCKSNIFVHQDQLCLESNGSLFSQYDAQDKWVFKGTYTPIEINLSRLNANVNFTDSVTVQGVTVSCGSQSIYVSEEATGSIISKTDLASTEFVLRPVGFSDSAYVLTNSSASNNLFARQIFLNTGSVGAQITVTNNYIGYAYPPVLSITSSASAIGEAAFILYQTSGGNARVIPFLSTGTVPGLSGFTFASISATANSIVIEPTFDPNRIHVAGQASAQVVTFTSGAYTNLWYTTYTPAGLSGALYVSTNTYQAVTTVVNPVNNTDLLIYVGLYPNPNLRIPGTVTYSDDRIVTFIRIGSGGAAISNDIYSNGLSLSGNAFRDEMRRTVYLPCIYVSPLQTTLLLCDVLEGRNRFNYFTGKCLYGQASSFISVPNGVNSFPVSQSYKIGTNTYRIINNRYFVDFDLSPDNSPQTQFFANTTHLTGGFLWSYDGDTIAEHNFLIGAERIEADENPDAIQSSVLVNGTGGVQEETLVSFSNASSYQTSNNRYLQFNTLLSTCSLYFVVDGVGTNPNLTGATNIAVPLTITDRGYDVAIKSLNAINIASVAAVASAYQAGPGGTITNQIVIVNSDVGPVPNAAAGGTNRGGPLSPGSYQYTFCYAWEDKSGNVYRSLTAPPVTVTQTGTSGSAIVLWAPSLTNKTIKDVKVELYRTLVNGTEFHYLDTIISMSSASARTGFYDSFSDSSISANRLLYTTGGVLDNYSIGACKSISFFKERLQATGIADDQFAIYYSKQVLPNEPVNFAAELYYRVDSDLTPVIATKQMDDKSIVFKPNLVYAISGDGANELGEGSSLSPPLLVASDVGTNIPNSVVLYPNGLLFKSAKGIYGLNRSLGVEYTGAQVENYNSFMVSGAVLMKNQTEIRFTQSDTSTGLIYNYFFGRWDFFSNYKGDSSTVYNGDMVVARSNGKVMVENSVFYDIDSGSQSYGIYLETPWLKLKGVQDFQRIYTLDFLGEYLSQHSINVNVSYDYDLTVDQSKDYAFDSASVIGGQPISGRGSSVYQFQVSLETQKCESIKVKFQEIPGTVGSQNSLYLNNLSANVGLKKGLMKLPPEKSV